jgi:asparagine synthase (glutamine-hydrolysing)
MTSPYLDKRVIEFCLAAPGHMKVRDGYNRYLIRRSLDGILPPKIQWRTTKMPFSPDYVRRYLAQIGKARDFVAAIGRRDPVRRIVDIDRLQSILNRPDVPAAKTMEAALVPVTIYLICFLRQFAEFRP